MNQIIFTKKITGFLIVLFLISCNDFLEEEVYTQYDPKDFLQTEEGINSVLISAYGNFHIRGWDIQNRIYHFNEFTSDHMWAWGGGVGNVASNFISFSWDSQNAPIYWIWGGIYKSIRNANSLLDNIDEVTEIPPEKIEQLKAEAIFIRAVNYCYLWELFGPVPLLKTTEGLDFEPQKATNEEFNNFIETELLSAANALPEVQELWGRATKGAALSFLGRFYLNTHQWGKSAAIYQEVISLNQYSLFQGNLNGMFSVENEVNNEVILSSPLLSTSSNSFNPIASFAFPPKYKIQDNWKNFGANFVLYNNFVKSYHPQDKRLGWILLDYVDLNGVYHDCLDPNDISRGARSFKFTPDPNANNEKHGNDFPMIRYAEVLLGRAEALNEINGLNQESVDLLNDVRGRAGVPLYSVSDFQSKDEFRDAILEERGWEFVSEGLRRVDLIRHGKFIEKARERGVSNAQDYMVRFPFPQSEINSNPNLEQNPGY